MLVFKLLEIIFLWFPIGWWKSHEQIPIRSEDTWGAAFAPPPAVHVTKNEPLFDYNDEFK